MMARARGLAAVSLLALLLCGLNAVPPAAAQEPAIAVSARMNSYSYAPGDLAYLEIDLKLPPAAREGGLDLELLVFSPATTRSHLLAFREDKRSHIVADRTLETIAPDEEWTNKLYEVDLKAMGLRVGVYPLEVRVVRYGETLASSSNFLVIMDPAAGYPLNISLLWTLDFLPTADAQGTELDGGLAAACSSSTSQTGFLYALTRVLKQTPEVPTSMVLPYATYRDLEDLAGKGGAGGGGAEDTGPSDVLSSLDEMISGGQLDLLNTTYAYADPDLVAAQGWEAYAADAEDDASRQMRLGVEGADTMGAKGSGFAAPAFRLSDAMLQGARQNGLDFAVVGEEAVRASAAGKRLLQGTTLSQPVDFINAEGLLLKAFVRDEVLYHYLEDTSRRDASHMVQGIVAELAVLQREKPYAVRSCVLAFPPSFVPSKEFLEDLYASVKGAPWLKARTMSDLNRDQFAIEGIALQAPASQPVITSYDQRLGETRSSALHYSAVIPEDHPLREDLELSILVAEKCRFMEENDVASAQRFLDSINAVVAGEMSQVVIEEKRSVTLSSTKGNLSVDVTNALDYPLSGVTLRLENASLAYPDGSSQVVTIEPRENRFIFSVNTHRKGSFIVDIVLDANGLVLDSASTTVNTSIINTLAIILLACLAGLVVLVALVRRISRNIHAGRHARGRGEE